MASELETLQAIQQHGDLNPVQQTRLKELQTSGATGNPQGIESPSGSYLNGNTQQPSQPNVGALPSFQQPSIDLPAIYDKLYADSGIKDTQASLSQKTNDYNAAVSNVKNNPFLSEATLTGRLGKLSDKYNADVGNLKNDVATKKADIETQLNLQTKQFDINSQQAQQSFNQFQSLLSSGALDNATPDTIASITRATGLSSDMIQSAIGTSKAKNAPKVNTQVIQVDDGKNISAVVIDQDTGKIINSQVIGDSTPAKATAASTKDDELKQNITNLTQSVKNGITLKSLVNAFYPALGIEDIYRIYNQYSPFGQAKESIDEVKQGKYIV